MTQLCELERLRKAAIALYQSERWVGSHLEYAEQEKLWEELRLALGLPHGTSYKP